MRSASKMELFAKRSTALVCCDSETIVFARTKRSQHDHEIVELLKHYVITVIPQGVDQLAFLIRTTLATKAFGKKMKEGILVLT